MNSMRGAVPFEAEGETYSLRLTTNAQCVYEDAAGETVAAAFKAIFAALRAEEAHDKGEGPAPEPQTKRLRRLFWAALSDHGLTEAEAGDLMDAVGLGAVARLLIDAVAAASPQGKDAPAGNGEAGKRPRKAPPAA